MGDQASLSSFHRDTVIPINFQEESGLVTFRSIELHEPHEVTIDVRPPVQMRQRSRAFSRVSTRYSDVSSCCEMKEETEFKPLQGNRAFFESGPLGVHST